jgi:hypothetical protein
MDFGAQQIGRWEMEKGDRKNLRLTKVYVGTGEGIAGEEKMEIRKRDKDNAVTRGDSRRSEERDASHIGRRGKSAEGTELRKSGSQRVPE